MWYLSGPARALGSSIVLFLYSLAPPGLAQDIERVEVTAARANVRSRPSIRAAIVGSVSAGTRLRVRGQEGTWVSVEPDDAGVRSPEAWLSRALVQPVREALPPPVASPVAEQAPPPARDTDTPPPVPPPSPVAVQAPPPRPARRVRPPRRMVATPAVTLHGRVLPFGEDGSTQQYAPAGALRIRWGQRRVGGLTEIEGSFQTLREPEVRVAAGALLLGATGALVYRPRVQAGLDALVGPQAFMALDDVERRGRVALAGRALAWTSVRLGGLHVGLEGGYAVGFRLSNPSTARDVTGFLAGVRFAF